MRAGDPIVVAHEEDAVGAGIGGCLRHRRADLVRLRRHRHLRVRQPLAEALSQPTDERAVLRHEIERQGLDVDVDAVGAGLLGRADLRHGVDRRPGRGG